MKTILRPGGLELTRRMLGFADFPAGARLIDVCCGAGATVELLLEAGFDAMGIDLEAEPGGLPLIRGSACGLPCEDASMDGILCECGFSLLEPDKALDEFSRVLKTGGALLFSDLYARAGPGRIGAARIHTRENFEAMLERHGFGLQAFEDCTDAFKSFLAQRIMEGGGDCLYEGCADISEIRAIKCGYCFLLARKLSS